MLFAVFSTLGFFITRNNGRALAAELPQQPFVTANEHDRWLDSDFDAFVQSTIGRLHVPGLSIAIVDEGKIYSKVAAP